MAERALATAFVNIVPGTVDLERYLKGQLANDVGGAGVVAGDKLAKGTATGFGSKIKSYFGPIAATFAASFGAFAVTNFFRDSVSAASNFAESANAVSVAYGKAAPQIAALGEDAATRLGLSSRAFNEIATRFSGFAETIAGDSGDLAGVIDDLSTRGADFASVFNINVNDALSLFQSGLAGETEPLRKYGIDLSAAAVENFALEQGIIKAGEALTEQQKVQARYALLMEETSKVQGDFANTSDSLANQQRIFAAQMEETQRKLGDALLPAMQALATVGNTVVIPAMKGVIDAIVAIGTWIGDNLPTFLTFVGVLGGLAIAFNAITIATRIYAAAQAILNAVLAVNPLALLAIAIAAVVAGIVYLATETTFFQDLWRNFTKFISEAWDNTTKFFTESFRNVSEFFRDTVDRIKNFFKAGWDNITQFFRGALQLITQLFLNWTVLGWIISNWGNIVQFFSTAWDRIIGFFKDALTNITKAVSDGVTKVLDFFRDLPRNIITALGNIGSLLFNVGRDIINGLINGIKSMFNSVGSAVSDIANNISGTFKNILGISSPSRVFQQYGEFIGDGLVRGIDSKAGKVNEAAKRLSKAATPAGFEWVVGPNGMRYLEATSVVRGAEQSDNPVIQGSQSAALAQANLRAQGFNQAQIDQIFTQAVGGTAREAVASLNRGVELVNTKLNQVVQGNLGDADIAKLQAQGFTLTNKIASSQDEVAKAIDDLAQTVISGNARNLLTGRKMATGGFVTKPTQAIIGEAGPEVVYPLKDFERVMGLNDRGSAKVVNYYAAPNQSLDSEQALFQAMKRAKVVSGW